MSSTPVDNGRRRIVSTPMLAGNADRPLLKILLAGVASTVINVAILVFAAVLFQFLGVVQAGGPEALDEQVTTTKVEEPQKDLDLTQTDLGTETDMEYNLPLDRVGEDVVVPGVVDVTQAVGIPGASEEAIRSNVPPPPGAGGGLGAALPNLEGAAAIGTIGDKIGGMGGHYLGNQFLGRSGGTKQKMLNEQGGNAASEVAVAKGLEWLALHQAQDGHWSLHEFNKHARTKPRPAGKIEICNCEAGTGNRNDVAATGFGLLPFLGAGITHRPGKASTKDYTKTVEGAINWLISKQAQDGSYSTDMYAHGIATIAMCEAFGLTSDPRIRVSAQRGLNFVASAQDPAGGGWRYAPRQAGDTSVTGWQMMALKSGQMAGLSVPPKVLKSAGRFLDNCETSDKGGYGYQPGQGETITMTSVGLLCRQYSDVGPKNPALQNGVRKLKAHPPGADNNIYYLYYATQVMHHMQGESWRFWNEGVDENGKKVHNGIRDSLITKQDKGSTSRHPHQVGSWGGSQGGRVMATSLSLLCLEVYYRHLPLYRRDLTTTKPNN